MAYTMERLEQALRLFRRLKKELINDGFAVSYLEDCIQSKYALRNRTLSRAKDLHSTWIDNDDSADYNPKNELQPKRKRVSRPERAAGPEREPKRQRVRPKQYDSLFVTLKFQCAEGRDFLSSLSSKNEQKQTDDTHDQQKEIQPLSVAADVNFLEDPSPHSSFSKSSTDSHIAEARALLEDLLSKPWKPRNSSAPEPQQPSSHEPSTASTETNSLTHQQQEKLEKSRSGIVRIITTSFAHPINFAYEQPPDDNSKPCHFCNDFTYGMLGLGEVKVEVIDYRDGSNYVKIEGGHVGTGHEPTRMCVTCALERVHIVQCRGHTVAPLDGYDPSTFDYDAAFASLEPPALGRRPSWSIRGACCEVDKFQEPVSPSSPDAVGCGLLLCANCARLMNIFQCDIGKVIAQNRRQDQQDWVRADAIYLLPGNDLYRFYCGEEQTKEEADVVDLTGQDPDQDEHQDIVMTGAGMQTIDLTDAD
ncbi:hypothetical protein M432DRAFT_639248 [Thermoascus aurantiacus ATCC 26904]